MRKICVVTGTRAEYGLLSRLMKMIDNDADTQLQIIATNMHLSHEYGLTYREIEADGFVIDKKVEMLLSSDTANATTKSIGLATIGMADALEDLSPDLIVILGDRYEMLSVATAALMYKIPIAHLHGGEITEGAYDDAIRHAITKMSHLHFTATDEYRNRVIQLGEQPDRVFNVGAIGIDNIKKIPLMSKEELAENLSFSFENPTILVTYHPVTLEDNSAEEQSEALLNALAQFPDLRILFTMPNSDTGGRIIIEKINQFVAQHKERTMAVTSLGMRRYLSALQFVNAVVGNSSSGIVEVPSFGIPSLNIGNRQKGRIRAQSVIDCDTTQQEITEHLQKVLQIPRNCSPENPYDKSNTCAEIFSVLKTFPLTHLIQKTFYNQ